VANGSLRFSDISNPKLRAYTPRKHSRMGRGGIQFSILFLCSLCCATVCPDSGINDVLDVVFRNIVSTKAIHDVADVFGACPEAGVAPLALMWSATPAAPESLSGSRHVPSGPSRATASNFMAEPWRVRDRRFFGPVNARVC
jgi:hypothetical protein